MKLVSIIIPCYNYGWLLAETLDSLLAQTYLEWEAIIIDDGSTDNSCDIAKKYQGQDSRFRYSYQPNGGISNARNCGLKLVRGEYVQFLDADDLLAPQKLAIQVRLLEMHPEVDLVYGDMRYFLHDNPSNQSRSMDMKDIAWMSKADGQGQKLLNAIIGGNLMVINSPLVRATLLHKVGEFNPTLRYVEDWDYWVRCAMAGACFLFDPNPEALALVRVHYTSASQNVAKMQQGEAVVRSRLKHELAHLGVKETALINKTALEHSRANLAAHRITNGEALRGIKDFVALAFDTNKYHYYLSSIIYWLKRR